jgi:hypothetical protein
MFAQDTNDIKTIDIPEWKTSRKGMHLVASSQRMGFHVRLHFSRIPS